MQAMWSSLSQLLSSKAFTLLLIFSFLGSLSANKSLKSHSSSRANAFNRRIPGLLDLL